MTSPERNFVGSEDNVTEDSRSTNPQDLNAEGSSGVPEVGSLTISEENESPEEATVLANDNSITEEERIRGMKAMLEAEKAEKQRLLDEYQPEIDPNKFAQGREGEAKWKQDYDPATGKSLRNEKGHFTTMDAEHERANTENERLDSINKKIAEIQRLLAELTGEINNSDDPDPGPTGSPDLDTPPGSLTPEDPPPSADISVSPSETTDPTTTDSPEPPIDPIPDPETNYEPTAYTPVPLYEPGYTTAVQPYAPSPEMAEDFRADFLRLVNDIARRDQERAIERFGGFRPFGALAGFLRLIRLRGSAELLENTDQRISQSWLGRTIGRVRGWFDKVGHRNVMDEEQIADVDQLEQNLEQAGRFQRRPWWKRALKIGGKVLGGFGVAGATIMTGGVGAATSLLWAGGLKEGYDGILQGIEDIGWGNRRGAAELTRQDALQERIEALRQRVITNEPPITASEWQAAVAGPDGILAAERQLMEQEATNITGERRGQRNRALISSALTIGTGLLGGVPIGEINYDTDNTPLANTLREVTGQPGMQLMQESHRGFWNAIHGGQFGYDHNSIASAIRDTINGATPSGAEFADMQNAIQTVIERAGGNWLLTDLAPYGQTAHDLLGGFAVADWLKVGSPLPYLLAEALRFGANRPGLAREAYIGRTDGEGPSYYTDQEPQTYSPEGGGAARLPEQLRRPPANPEEAVGRERQAAEAYARQQEQSDPDLQSEINEFAESLPAMENECRASICVPAAYSEHRVIYNYLDSLKTQQDIEGNPLDPKKFEILVFVNGPEDKQQEIDQTIAEINRFKSENPEIKVHVLSKAYQERQNIGLLRKIINDVALQRSMKRPQEAGPLYLISHDADNVVTENQYLAKSIKAMDENYENKILAGASDFDDETKQKYPFVWVARRLWQFCDEIRAGKSYGNLLRKACGNNSVIRAEAYARVGGYKKSDSIAEDLALARDINAAYSTGQETRQNKPVANLGIKVDFSPRRDLQSVQEGKSIIRGYDNFIGNQSVRENLRANNVEQITPANEALFLRYLKNEANSQFNSLFMEQFWALSGASAEMKRLRASNAPRDQIERLQTSQLQGEVGQQAMQLAEKTFVKASDYLGMRVRILPARNGQYRVEIVEWDKLKQRLAQKTPAPGSY